MLRGLMLAVLLCAVPFGAANAGRWQSSIDKDDFGDHDTGIAIVESEGRAFGVRCENGKVPAVLFATRQRWAEHLGVIPAQLLVKVDENEPTTNQAVMDSYQAQAGFTAFDAVRVVAPGDAVLGLIAEIAKARKRVAVAVELGGERYENMRFPVAGSTNAIKKIWQYCGSEHGEYEKPTL